jgi:hypothetical protein
MGTKCPAKKENRKTAANQPPRITCAAVDSTRDINSLWTRTQTLWRSQRWAKPALASRSLVHTTLLWLALSGAWDSTPVTSRDGSCESTSTIPPLPSRGPLSRCHVRNPAPRPSATGLETDGDTAWRFRGASMQGASTGPSRTRKERRPAGESHWRAPGVSRQL